MKEAVRNFLQSECKKGRMRISITDISKTLRVPMEQVSTIMDELVNEGTVRELMNTSK